MPRGLYTDSRGHELDSQHGDIGTGQCRLCCYVANWLRVEQQDDCGKDG
jgi:hypothetical protein